ncbi:MAG TPA: (Fe-S)-binding protein [Gemmatales bacterium]|nr:(Fe-S)-binding protein [Gemmatales bacterium]
MPPHPLPTIDPSKPATIGKGIDYELFLDCVHCGLCTSACPTYVELGTEMDSPRGRIYLMRGVVDGRIPLDNDVKQHLDLCLNCRACETACPSGVQYGRLIEPFRNDLVKTNQATENLPWWQRLVIFNIFPYPWRARLALAPAKLLQWLRLDQVIAQIMPRRMRAMQEMLPRLKSLPALPEFLPAEGTKRATVGLLTGCINDVVLRHVNWATAKVLQKNGCDVWTPRSQGCCGALHLHAGQEAPAIQFAEKLCDIMLDRDGIDAFVTNVAGCGSTLKDYAHLLAHTPYAEKGTRFQSKVKDINEFLMELGPIKPTHPLKMRATYHDACHLYHAQKIRQAPRDLLGLIPGLELVPLAESEICCGAAGSYNLTQPEMAERLGKRKSDNLLATQPEAVFTANAGCLLQIAKHLRPEHPNIWVAHPVEALWASYSGEKYGD